MEEYQLALNDFQNINTLKVKLHHFFCQASGSHSGLLRARLASLTLIDAIAAMFPAPSPLESIKAGFDTNLRTVIFENRQMPAVALFIDKHNLIVKSDESGFIEPSEEAIMYASMELASYMMDVLED